MSTVSSFYNFIFNPTQKQAFLCILIQIFIIAFKIGSFNSQYKHAYGSSNFPYTSYRPRPVWLSVPSTNFFLWPQSTNGAFPPSELAER